MQVVRLQAARNGNTVADVVRGLASKEGPFELYLEGDDAVAQFTDALYGDSIYCADVMPKVRELHVVVNRAPQKQKQHSFFDMFSHGMQAFSYRQRWGYDKASDMEAMHAFLDRVRPASVSLDGMQLQDARAWMQTTTRFEFGHGEVRAPSVLPCFTSATHMTLREGFHAVIDEAVIPRDVMLGSVRYFHSDDIVLKSLLRHLPNVEEVCVDFGMPCVEAPSSAPSTLKLVRICSKIPAKARGAWRHLVRCNGGEVLIN